MVPDIECRLETFLYGRPFRDYAAVALAVGQGVFRWDCRQPRLPRRRLGPSDGPRCYRCGRWLRRRSEGLVALRSVTEVGSSALAS